MKSYSAVGMIVAALVMSSQGIVTNTVQFGGAGWDKSWGTGIVTNSAVSPTEYSVSYGVPEKYSLSEISNLLFTVTFTEINGIPVYSAANWIFPSIDEGVIDRRLNSNEVVRLTTSYSDPDNKLLGLRVSGFGTTFNTLDHETMVFSDGMGNSTSITASASDTIFDYDAAGLDPLSTNNIATWEMLVSVDDTLGLGGGTNFTEAGMGAFVLEYIADIDEIPSAPTLTPVFYDFVDTGEFDNQGVGVTMTRSNGWDTAISITTIEIIGADGTSATNGVNNKTNIQSVDALGVNSANLGNSDFGSESRDFNPVEAWVISFDTDVYLVEIDMASQGDDSEMTLSSPVFSNFVMLGRGDDNTDGTWDLLNLFVPAGTNVMFQMTSTTNASDVSLRIDDLTVQSVLDANSYDAWAQDEGLIYTVNDAYEDDPDQDHMDNLAEYAFGGDPLVDDASVYLPDYELTEDGGSESLDYIYRRRMDRVAQGLSYKVGSGTDLTGDPLTNATFEAGSVAIDGTYESVTNQVSVDTEDQQFMQLKVLTD